jgi:hypothetical protein
MHTSIWDMSILLHAYRSSSEEILSNQNIQRVRI